MLGHLHAVDAVPLLIKTLGLRESVGVGFRYSGPEKSALVEIGAGAVPQLIDSLRLAGDCRHGINWTSGIEPAYLEIEQRIVDVLGDIGDRRALPVLEELKKSAKPIFVADLDEAIEKIREKSRH